MSGRCVCHYLFGQAAVSDEAVEMSDSCCIYAARVVLARGQICSSYVVQGSTDACPRTEPQNPPSDQRGSVYQVELDGTHRLHHAVGWGINPFMALRHPLLPWC